MITAHKSLWFDRIFIRYNEWYLLRRNFHSFTLSGELDSIPANQPAVYIMNHSSWWDGLLIYHAFRHASAGDHYVMMEERQLRRYTFFGKLGAFSIDKSSPGDIRLSLRYAAELLNQGKRVWMFPQGEMRHLEERPLTFRPGIGLLLRQTAGSVPVIPVTLYYGLYQHARLQASLHIGAPVYEDWSRLSARACASQLEALITSQLDQQRAISLTNDGELPGARDLIRRRSSTDDKYDHYRRIRKR
ncbi:lysophospholipid acyltransferase family protein [Paenibacillus shenyangensis]|uniref:lysophospholipid acyltransferase family protein n=1 Tax=Paenibacillus sp. A9 TaxID=1284352 RepID=UPI0003648743|nr:lysophospholipid acyltransferase family protein [Paenibacillus sp. A9]